MDFFNGRNKVKTAVIKTVMAEKSAVEHKPIVEI